MLLGALLMYLICFVYRKKKGEKYDVNDEAKVMSVASLREVCFGYLVNVARVLKSICN